MGILTSNRRERIHEAPAPLPPSPLSDENERGREGESVCMCVYVQTGANLVELIVAIKEGLAGMHFNKDTCQAPHVDSLVIRHA